MKNLKKALSFSPELFFIVAGIVAFVGELAGTGKISYAGLALVAVFLLQLKFQNKIAGYIIGFMLALVCLYMLFAVYSEFSEFETTTAEAIKMLAMGWALFGAGLIFAGLLVAKNMKVTT